MNKDCIKCGTSFEITDDDLTFYDKVSPTFAGTKYQIPPPPHCPDCRMQCRMAWCNEQHLYHNTCQHTGKPVIAQLPASNPRPVWNIQDWWSDAFDPLEYGRDLDLSRSFLEQLHELELVVPHACVNTDLENENSEYTHHAGHEKNCYLMFHTSYVEDCLYGYGVKKAKSCVDNYYCHESELCYECVDVKNCYGLAWSQECQNCSSSWFIRDCIGCSDCLLCTGLRNKKFCILNEQLTEQEYKQRLAETNFGSYVTVKELWRKYQELQLAHPRKHLKNEMTENCLGDHLIRAKNCRYCFDCSDIEESAYCSNLQLGTKYCRDIYQFGINIELCYEGAMIGYSIYNCHFCYDLLEQCHDLLYCLSCFASKQCFGCFGLKHNQYCILNTQYSQEEYEALVSKIIEKMQADGEWGEYLPVAYSQSAYNETNAQHWYPLSKEEVAERGWQWFDEEETDQQYMGPKVDLPDDINDVSDDICDKILVCEVSGKPYKIIPQELAFYRQLGVPLPRRSFVERHKQRFSLRNPRQLWGRQCAKCNVDIKTTYAPDRPEVVYCEECYLQSVS